MIELKNVTAKKKGGAAMEGYSALFRNGGLRLLDRAFGELVIDVVLGFCPVEAGFVCYDGMPLSPQSANFLRKMAAYIPTPEGFRNAVDLRQKQREMIAGAMQSDAAVVLAVEPFSHLPETEVREAMALFRKKADEGAVVIIATDRNDLRDDLNAGFEGGLKVNFEGNFEKEDEI
ncbi:MAG: ABC transporter ATP-binding protein [Prevotella sp.]|nr:ABC transporter ATP-binding protein [Prevotella sp.]